MALTESQRADVQAMLTDQPELRDSDIRKALDLPTSALFAVARERRALGIASPPKPAGSAPTKRRRRRSADSESVETLDADGSDATPGQPTGPRRRGASPRPQSILAPVLPRIAQAIAQGAISFSASLTQGRATMTRDEAAAVAIPTVRIADRTLAKYVKKSGKVSPNQEDAALIALTLVVWAVGWLIAVMQGRPRTAPQASDQSDQPQPSQGFTHSPVATGAVAPQASDADSDLFAGSEPAPITPAARSNGHGLDSVDPSRQRGVSDATWAAIMPTDTGQALVN